jgi:hypothetical protein
MRRLSRIDFSLNVFTPLLAGALVYYLATVLRLPGFIKNFLPDGLWAYALVSAIFIIWDRRPAPGWIITCYVVAIGFEMAQYMHWVPGTGDFIDGMVYCIGMTAGVGANSFFKRKFLLSPINNHHEQEKKILLQRPRA